jgi:hypothetical protein
MPLPVLTVHLALLLLLLLLLLVVVFLLVLLLLLLLPSLLVGVWGGHTHSCSSCQAPCTHHGAQHV